MRGTGFWPRPGSSREQLLTDEYAFLLWQCGDPAFASIPTRIYPRQASL